MPKLFLLLIFILILFTKATSQINDTLYFDNSGKSCQKEKANYYRLIQSVDREYKIRDFYMSHILKREVMATSLDPEVLDGQCTYYHINGKIRVSGVYNHGKRVGIWNEYNSKGKLINSYDYDKDQRQELIKTFDSSSWVSQNQSSLFIINANYRFKMNAGYLSSGHGFGAEFGFNLGYFISQKFLLAPFVGIGTRDILYQTKFTPGYMSDFNRGFNSSQLSGNDSLIVNYMASIMSDKGYYHQRLSYYGLMIKLPYKYIPILKMYTGESSLSFNTFNEPVQPQPLTPSNRKTDKDYFDITQKLNWGFEVFLYNGRTRVRNSELPLLNSKQKQRLKWSSNLLALSLYIEQYGNSKSKFTYSNGYYNIHVPMSSFMTQEYMNKYKKTYNIGIRLSCGIF